MEDSTIAIVEKTFDADHGIEQEINVVGIASQYLFEAREEEEVGNELETGTKEPSKSDSVPIGTQELEMIDKQTEEFWNKKKRDEAEKDVEHMHNEVEHEPPVSSNTSLRLKEDEQKLAAWMETFNEEAPEMYFKMDEFLLDGGSIKSMLPGNQITTPVIDLYCQLLNMNEDSRSKSSPLRLFVPSSVTVFFFVNASEHHYVICFNIKKPSFEDHPKESDIANLHLVRLKMKWTTMQNHLDYGVFVIRHMEHYLGVAKGWDCGLNVECHQQQQLDVLRIRYTYRILLHEKNKRRQNVEFLYECHHTKAQEKLKEEEKLRKKRAVENVDKVIIKLRPRKWHSYYLSTYFECFF
ncbi:hypothetical protein POM88_041213 [Heracleum sosnowskyi]|uniref:Ubiquitin-like protease family profile domain-containing protein n=1 Tax=Heracleum sosnowskyi TaxID=360622 RepID=A0AAD8HGD4_9APIA|nr:hypothetical protein POM88_041213 [Heracleum sosnowskyi]